MYVDSGADISLLPRRLGKALGLSFEGKHTQEIGGIGGKRVPVTIAPVKMKVGRKVMDVRVAWSHVEDVPLILGRMDVFDIFKVTFDQRNGLVHFESD